MDLDKEFEQDKPKNEPEESLIKLMIVEESTNEEDETDLTSLGIIPSGDFKKNLGCGG